MSHDSPEICRIKIELWALGHQFYRRELSEGTFEQAITTLHELWARFKTEQQKEAG